MTSQGKTADVFGSEAGLFKLVLRPCGSEAQPTVDTRPRGAVCMGTPSPDESPLPLSLAGSAEPESAIGRGRACMMGYSVGRGVTRESLLVNYFACMLENLTNSALHRV